MASNNKVFKPTQENNKTLILGSEPTIFEANLLLLGRWIYKANLGAFKGNLIVLRPGFFFGLLGPKEAGFRCVGSFTPIPV